jgi:glyoxylase-like metal-dependent hydrolase (beta-lactamase superfamily II)/ADP-ribose pyrophosphatase YjhB (NUDIX family)
MPGHHAFPGGVVDAADRPGDEGSFARCVAREIEEECGLSIPAPEWSDAGERITPPLFPLRYRTRFFVTQIPDPSLSPRPASEENEQLIFSSPLDALAQWERGRIKVPPPVLPILRAVGGAGSSAIDDVVRAVAEANLEEERAPRIEFVPGVWMTPVRTATLPPATHTNVWLPGKRRFAVVDPGSADNEEVEKLLGVVARRARDGDSPCAVLLTHHHRDHLAGAVIVAARLDLPIRAHTDVLDGLDAPSGTEMEPIADGELLDLGGESLEAHHTPGHAPGHLAFHLRERRALIAGDMVGGMSTILIDPEQGDMGAYLDSLARLRRLDCRTLLPGHGPPLPARELGRVVAHRRMRESLVLQMLDCAAPKELGEIAAGAYADLPQMPAVLTRGQTLSHLLLLERNGRVRREDPDRSRWRRAGEGGGR